MSLARATVLTTRIKPPAVLTSQVRLASTSAHDDHHDSHAVDHHHDAVQYPEEGFTSKGWIYTVVAGVGLVAFYKFAPAKGEPNRITSYLSGLLTPKEIWNEINNKHLDLSVTEMQEKLQVQSAQRPSLVRYRYPQSMNIASPMCIPVGLDPDVSSVKAKTDKDW